MITKIFTFGCSFTKDNYQQTWADLLAERYCLQLLNRAERGCGANYISKRVLTSDDIDGRDSVVVIMWPCADRYDLWVDSTTPHLLDDVDTASWPDGKKPMLVDLQGGRKRIDGFILNGSVPRGYKNYHYKFFYSPYQAVHDWYANIIQTQLYLKSIGVPMLMVSAWPLVCPLQYHIDDFKIEKSIFDKIDRTLFAEISQDLGFFNYCRQQNLEFLNDHYPATSAHENFSKNFLYAPFENIINQAIKK